MKKCNNPACPYCNKFELIKNGVGKGVNPSQAYKCKNCNKNSNFKDGVHRTNKTLRKNDIYRPKCDFCNKLMARQLKRTYDNSLYISYYCIDCTKTKSVKLRINTWYSTLYNSNSF